MTLFTADATALKSAYELSPGDQIVYPYPLPPGYEGPAEVYTATLEVTGPMMIEPANPPQILVEGRLLEAPNYQVTAVYDEYEAVRVMRKGALA